MLLLDGQKKYYKFLFFDIACDFELSGPEGFVESTQIAKEGKAQLTEAVDCRWYIRAPPRAKVGTLQSMFIHCKSNRGKKDAW